MLIAGIHIGNEYSVLAIHQQNRDGEWTTEVIANEDGDRQIPSYCLFGDHDVLTGTVAKSQSVRNFRQVVQGFHHELYNDKVYHLQGEEGDIQKSAFDAMVVFLESLKLTVESNVGAAIDGCVLTGSHSQADTIQVEKLKKACQKANMNLLNVIPEPVAVWLATQKDIRDQGMEVSGQDSDVVVVDVGGWSTKVSVLAIRSGIPLIVAQKVSSELSGDVIDTALVKHFQQEFEKKHRMQMSDDKKSLRKLKKSVEQVKVTLSNSQQAPITIESLYDGMDFSSSLHRGRLETLCDGIFKKLVPLVEDALKMAHLQTSDVLLENVHFVGGCAKIPKLQELLAQLFPGLTFERTFDTQTVFAIGCVVEAEQVEDKKIGTQFVHDVTDFELSIRLLKGSLTLVPVNHPLPLKRVFEPQLSAEHDSVLTFVASKDGIESIVGELKVGKVTPEMEFRLIAEVDQHVQVALQELLSGATQVIKF